MDRTIVQREPNILLLRGVFIKDLLDDNDDTLFDNKYTAELDDPVVSEIIAKPLETQYNSIPREFHGWHSWTSNTNLACWNCDRTFKTPPIFVVGHVHRSAEGKRVIEPEGNFCTDNCAQSYINATYSGVLHDDKTKYQMLMRMERIKKDVTLIKPAESKTCMKRYSGPTGCTPEEYGKRIDILNSDYSIQNFCADYIRVGCVGEDCANGKPIDTVGATK